MQLSCACVLYLLLVADFFNDLFEHHALSYSVWTVIAGCILLPSVFLNQLKRISWLSMFSVVALIMVFVSVIGYGVTQRYDWDFNLGVTTLQGFPVAWGIILFSFVCHPYLPGNTKIILVMVTRSSTSLLIRLFRRISRKRYPSETETQGYNEVSSGIKGVGSGIRRVGSRITAEDRKPWDRDQSCLEGSGIKLYLFVGSETKICHAFAINDQKFGGGGGGGGGETGSAMKKHISLRPCNTDPPLIKFRLHTRTDNSSDGLSASNVKTAIDILKSGRFEGIARILFRNTTRLEILT